MTANNAMLADLASLPTRAEAFGISRVAVNGGMVVGPLAASFFLGAGLAYRPLFVAGGAVCGLFLLLILLRIKESRPAAAASAADLSVVAGYRVVLRDRRFLAFCAVALLPLYGFGQFFVTLPVLLRDSVGVSASTWGLLAALYAGCGVLFQYLVVRRTKDWNKMGLLAAASAFIGAGMAGAAYAPPGVVTGACVLLYSVGVMLLVPISAAVVSEMAPLHLRGRYMGAWTLVWMAGCSLGPTFGGLAMDRLGARGAYGVILAAALLGTVLFASLRRGLPARRRAAVRAEPGVVPADDSTTTVPAQQSSAGTRLPPPE